MFAMSPLPEIDLRRRAGPLHQHQVEAPVQVLRKLSITAGRSSLFRLAVVARVKRRPALPPHDHLRAGVGLRLEQHRVHVHRWRNAGSARLQHLRAADLPAVSRDAGIVRHVLRLERRDLQAAVGERAGKASHDQRLADVRPGALEHDGRRARHRLRYSRSHLRRQHVRRTCPTATRRIARTRSGTSTGGRPCAERSPCRFSLAWQADVLAGS